MEIEYFVEPGTEGPIFETWKDAMWQWCLDIGLSPERLRVREHTKEELSHYSSRTLDIEYKYPWGWGELYGLANRADFDLTQHATFSGQDMTYTDPDDPTKKFVPYVVEPTFGLTRTVLSLLLEAYEEEKLAENDTRTVLHLKPFIAPYDLAILPLSKKEHLSTYADELHAKLVAETGLVIDYDVTGSIGKRYRRQDEVGTPKCVTVDFGTIGEDAAQGEKDTVTIRDRDTQKQDRLTISTLIDLLRKR